jgi:putative membrane protein
MIKLLIHVFGIAFALLALSEFGVGVVVENFYSAVVVAVLWGVLMLTVRPILGLLTLPINLLTFGLFSFVLNALLFWLLATFVQGFAVAGFIPALIGSVALSLVSAVLHRLS